MSATSDSIVASAIRRCVFMSRRFSARCGYGNINNWAELVDLHTAACSACLNSSAAGPLRAILMELHAWDKAKLPGGALGVGMKKGDKDSRPQQLRVRLESAAGALARNTTQERTPASPTK